MEEGKIRGYAWSTDVLESVEVFAKGPHCTAVQNELNIFRCEAAMLELSERENLAAVSRSALAWIWGRSERTIPIPGFKNLQQAEENARAKTFGPLTPEQMDEIDALLGK